MECAEEGRVRELSPAVTILLFHIVYFSIRTVKRQGLANVIGSSAKIYVVSSGASLMREFGSTDIVACGGSCGEPPDDQIEVYLGWSVRIPARAGWRPALQDSCRLAEGVAIYGMSSSGECLMKLCCLLVSSGRPARVVRSTNASDQSPYLAGLLYPRNSFFLSHRANKASANPEN